MSTASHVPKYSLPKTLLKQTSPLLSHIIQPFVLYHLRCANVFNAAPLVAFRRSNNLSNLLVRTKRHDPNQSNQPRGSFRCGSNCLTCNCITDGLTGYTFFLRAKKQDLFTITLNVTLKRLFTWCNAIVVTSNTLRRNQTTT